MRLQPCPAGNVLGVAELWCSNFFSAKVLWCFDGRISFYCQGSAGIGRAGKYTNFFAVRFEVGVERRAWAYVGAIERSGEDRLHRWWPAIVSKPLNLHIRAQPFFNPSLALPRECMCNDALSMRD